jgi:hypothetical protein
MEVHDLRPRGGALYTVLAELYSNALEHGLMGLDSRLKCDAEGFARYYAERRERLQNLSHGFVRFHLDLAPHGDGGAWCCGSRTAATASTSAPCCRPAQCPGPGFQRARPDPWCGSSPTAASGRRTANRYPWSFSGPLRHNPPFSRAAQAPGGQGVSECPRCISTMPR